MITSVPGYFMPIIFLTQQGVLNIVFLKKKKFLSINHALNVVVPMPGGKLESRF